MMNKIKRNWNWRIILKENLMKNFPIMINKMMGRFQKNSVVKRVAD
jgi:hypothetical protein